MSNRTESVKREGEVFPDSTVFYRYEKANEILNSLDRKKYYITDVILMLLYSHPDNPLFGRISMMKQVFLLIEEVLNKEEVQDPKYIPYHYGMYSFTVTNDLTNLEYSGFISREGKKNSKFEAFMLTKKGIDRARELFSLLPNNIKNEIYEKRKGWDQLGCDGILRLVYRDYPEYKDKSKLKNKYKSIQWGRGRG